MTHYTIQYSGTKQEKDKKAVNDCLDYLGERRFNNLCEAIVNSYKSYDTKKEFMYHIRIQLSLFVGIEGYPVRPLVRYALQNHPIN